MDPTSKIISDLKNMDKIEHFVPRKILISSLCIFLKFPIKLTDFLQFIRPNYALLAQLLRHKLK